MSESFEVQYRALQEAENRRSDLAKIDRAVSLDVLSRIEFRTGPIDPERRAAVLGALGGGSSDAARQGFKIAPILPDGVEDPAQGFTGGGDEYERTIGTGVKWAVVHDSEDPPPWVRMELATSLQDLRERALQGIRNTARMENPRELLGGDQPLSPDDQGTQMAPADAARLVGQWRGFAEELVSEGTFIARADAKLVEEAIGTGSSAKMARTEIYLLAERGLEGGAGRPRIIVQRYPAEPPQGNVIKVLSARQVARFLERRAAVLERYGSDGAPLLVSMRRTLGI